MSVTVMGSLLVLVSVAISVLLIFRLQSRVPSSRASGQNRRGRARTLIVPAAGFLLVVAIGAATSYLGARPDAIAISRSGPDGEMLARLKDFAGATGAEQSAFTAEGGKLLPDVNTMIERLVARLETTPEDVKGWRMLGWSYFNTGRYEQAATAYAKAVALDPNSAELKLSYEEAKAKASGQSREKNTEAEAMPPRERDAAIRSMVDGLANRLERSPRDVEGWARLMRSRIVLGEREVAAAAFRKALEVFKDDPAASGKITAAAIELGLKTE